jgi:hypothetical protein
LKAYSAAMINARPLPEPMSTKVVSPCFIPQFSMHQRIVGFRGGPHTFVHVTDLD